MGWVNITGTGGSASLESIVGEKSHSFRLGKAYLGKGIVSYKLKTNQAKRALIKYYEKSFFIAIDNPICRNLMQIYKKLTMPTIEEIKTEAKRLVTQRFKTKKGKILKRLNKHKKSYFKKADQYSFVEDSIELFEYLTDNGFMIPKVGDYKSGGRIVDSFTLMPSWIRNMIKINKSTLTECDYSCFHPNIAINLFGGNSEYLTHHDIHQKLGIDIKTVARHFCY